MVVAPRVVTAAEVVPLVRLPVVNTLMDCDMATSSKPSTLDPIMPALNCLLTVSVGLNRPFRPSTRPALAAGLTVA